MRLPRGHRCRSRVVSDPRTALVSALDRRLTGYATLEPQSALLLDGDGQGVLTFAGGVPVVAYHTGTGRGGPPALADLAAEGPYRLELFALDPGDLADVHDVEAFRVPPGMPAERLAGDRDLAARTRERAPADRRRDGSADCETDADSDTDTDAGPARSGDRQPGAVEAFLEDEEKIEALRERAREEARERADEWGFETETETG